MKKVIPKQTVEVCDFCHRDGYLTDCWVCGRQFCLSDEGTVPRSYGFTSVCRECGHRDDVREVCDKWAEQLVPLFRARDDELKALGAKRRPEDKKG